MSSQSSELEESVPEVVSGTKMSWPLDPVDMSTGPLVPWMLRSKCGPLGAPLPVVELVAEAEPPTSIRLSKSGEARTAPARKRFLTIVPPCTDRGDGQDRVHADLHRSVVRNTAAQEGRAPKDLLTDSQSSGLSEIGQLFCETSG